MKKTPPQAERRRPQCDIRYTPVKGLWFTNTNIPDLRTYIHMKKKLLRRDSGTCVRVCFVSSRRRSTCARSSRAPVSRFPYSQKQKQKQQPAACSLSPLKPDTSIRVPFTGELNITQVLSSRHGYIILHHGYLFYTKPYQTRHLGTILYWH